MPPRFGQFEFQGSASNPDEGADCERIQCAGDSQSGELSMGAVEGTVSACGCSSVFGG